MTESRKTYLKEQGLSHSNDSRFLLRNHGGERRKMGGCIFSELSTQNTVSTAHLDSSLVREDQDSLLARSTDLQTYVRRWLKKL